MYDFFIFSENVRNILQNYGLKWRKSKTILSNKSNDPTEYIEKKYIQQLWYNTHADSLLLYQDERGPVTAKTHGGSSGSSTQVMMENASKIKGLLMSLERMTKCIYMVIKRK